MIGRTLRYYLGSPLRAFLSVACLLAWISLALGVWGLALTARERGTIILFDCPPCAKGNHR